VTAKSKRRRGRPTIAAQPGARFMIHVPPDIAAKLKALGSGSLSRGVIRSAGGETSEPPVRGAPAAKRARHRALDQLNERLKARGAK